MEELTRLSDRLETRLLEPGAPSRLSIDMASERVLFFIRAGRLTSLCTCTVPQCEHVVSALRWLGGEGSRAPESSTLKPEPKAGSGPPLTPQSLEQLANAFDAVLLAIVRGGAASASSPSLRDAIDQLVEHSPEPTPLAIARSVGRLQDALAENDPGRVARVLEGMRRFAQSLRQNEPDADARIRRSAWLASTSTMRTAETIEHGWLVEIARERLAGLSRNAIERRYLFDLEQGTVLREERHTSEPEITLGPCGRLLHVAFGEIEPFGEPRRVRLLQYAVAPQADTSHWQRVTERAQRSVAEVVAFYCQAVESCPAIAEPVVCFAPAEVHEAERPTLRDAAGDALALGDTLDGALADVVVREAKAGRLVWVAGRLMGLSEGLVLRPMSLLLRAGDELSLARLS